MASAGADAPLGFAVFAAAPWIGRPRVRATCLVPELGQVQCRQERAHRQSSLTGRRPGSVHEAVDYLCKYPANLWATRG